MSFTRKCSRFTGRFRVPFTLGQIGEQLLHSDVVQSPGHPLYVHMMTTWPVDLTVEGISKMSVILLYYHGRLLIASSFRDTSCGRQRRMFGSSQGKTESKVIRDKRFSELNEGNVDHFRRILGDKDVVVDSDELKVANTDWMNKYHGHSKLLLLPQSTAQVSEILQYCKERVLVVVPQGGNTGLVGGSVPVFDEIVLSLAAMNKMISFDEVSGILVCEAGCILQSLDDFVGSRAFTMPLDLGAKGSFQIWYKLQ